MNCLSHLISSFEQRTGVAVQFKKNEVWEKISWPEYFHSIAIVASGLHQLGVTKETQVAIMANTRFEWSACDLALLGLGAISVPLYHTASSDEVEQILLQTECEVLVVENRSLMKNIMPITEKLKRLKHVVFMESGNFDMSMFQGKFSMVPWDSFLKSGKIDFKETFAGLCMARSPSDIATLLFTSGTTGRPKGVVLTHSAAYSEVTETFTRVGVDENDSTLTFLPFSHILGRIENWGHIFSGYTLNFAESIDRIRQNLLEIKPTVMVAVPRIFEKVHSGIEAQMQGSPVQRAIASRAVKIGLEVAEQLSFNRIVSLKQAVEYELAKAVVLNKIKNAFGGRLRFAISGGAPLNIDIAKFFHACGVLVLEGYGLSETTAAICVNTPNAYQFGTVGKPIGEVQVKIAEDGEILVKSQKVMREYYNDPEATAQALVNGWFHTGDVGEFTADGFLKITDRKKDLIKTAGGKYVAPQKLEALLKSYGEIANVLIYGDQKKFIVALITLDKGRLISWAKVKDIKYKDYDSLTQSPQVFDLVRRIVTEVNSKLGHFESIKRFSVLPRDFTVEDGELTPSLKVKRKVLSQKFAAELEKLYQ